MASDKRGLLVRVLSSVLLLGMMGAPPAATREQARDRFDDPFCAGPVCTAACPCVFDQWQAARLLKFGYGMTADNDVAAYWYRRAAEKGDARAAFNYGLMLIDGLVTAPDPTTGLSLILEAADASVSEAWFALGNLRRQGDRVDRDTLAAIAAYRKAAERGHVRSQHALGNMYGNGQGVGVDLVTAYKWWHLASRKGHEFAEQALRLATSMMTSTEISLGQRAANDWVVKKKQR